MFDYPRYFNEWDVPPAGIDTISIWIHPYLINYDKDAHKAFHKEGNVREAINLRLNQETDYITKRVIRTNYHMDIQAEAINPNDNIFNQILGYLIELFHSEILTARDIPDETLFMPFLMHNFNALFSLNYIDFYFDIREEDAILPGWVNPKYPNTQYSTDYSLKTYNRIVQLKQKNAIKHELIEQITHPRRIEFHLTRETCRYLHCNNLNGDFNAVFLKHIPFFARKWLRYKRQIIDIPNIKKSDYHYLKQIDSVANQSTIPHTKSLEKTPRKPVPFKKAKKNEVDYDWFPRFLSGK